MSKGTFEIYIGNDKQYWFRLKAGNGEIIGKSEGYPAKQSAQHGIESVRQNSQDDDNFSIFKGVNDQYYFHLKAKNGEVILSSSEGYVSEQGVKIGIDSVRRNAPDAQVKDLTGYEVENTDNEVENTDNEIGENDQDIVSPFSVKDIKVTHATVMLPTIINRLNRDEIGIPSYQRHPNLWTNNQKSRLIESILLKLPLPVFYFDASDPEKWMVIDGLQRISTIRSFFVEKTLKLKELEFLTELNGKKCDDLPIGMQRTIEDTMFVAYQIEAQTPKEVRYSIFNRINTGGLSLKPQEIRQALNQKGKGVEFLIHIVKQDIFKEVVGISNKRMTGQELVLRFMAFKVLNDKNFKTMDKFLDLAMEEIDTKSPEELNVLQNKLIKVLEFSNKVLGEKHKFSRSIADEAKNKLVNLSLFDVLTVCFDEITDKDLFLKNKDFFVRKLKEMLSNESADFFVSITKGTSGKWAKDTRFREIRDLIEQTLKNGQ